MGQPFVISENERKLKVEHQETPHKRRVRYKGTHPRSYKEKYKELQPDKYADTIEKVIRKGSTPAGMHISICVREILDFLQIRPGQTGLDATLGYSGHTERMLRCLEGKGHLHAMDVDQEESQKTIKRPRALGYGEDILTVHLMNFAQMDQVAEKAGGFDFVLADLGVSSMQIDNPDRGFSYKTEGPLDLRMNQQKGISAAERLRNIDQEELAGMLMENADELYAVEISREIIGRLRRGRKIATTQLREAIESALSFLPPKEQNEAAKNPASGLFRRCALMSITNMKYCMNSWRNFRECCARERGWRS